MLNGLDTGIARLSRGGEVLALNDTYVSLYAIDRDDPKRPGGAVEYSALRGDPLPESDRPFARAARGELFEDERVWLFDTNGEWHALSASTRRLTPSTDEPDSTLLIVHDVTALIEAERARERLAAVVSHELRNPLTAIMGHAELALDGEGLPPKTREQLEVIENAAVRMQTLISEILAGSRRSEEHTSELQSLMRISYAVFCLKKKNLYQEQQAKTVHNAITHNNNQT